MAQNKRQIVKRIAGLQRRIEEHKLYIAEEPVSRAQNHWRREVGAWESEIRRLKSRLER